MAGRFSTGLQNALAGITTELNSNGDFAAAITGWTGDGVATVAFDADDGVGGGGCLSVGAAAGYAYRQFTALNPGQLHKLTVSYKGTNNAGGNGYPRISIGTAAGGRTIHDSGASALTATTHTTYTVYFTTPTDIADYDIYINMECTGTGVQFFDDISLTCMSHSIQDMMKYAVIDFYSGTQPADPDNVPGATLLCTVKNGTAGITWRDAVDGVTGKYAGETWTGVCVATGTVGWFRVRLAHDAGGSSTTLPRIDGAVGTSGAQINFPNLSFETGATQTVSDLTVTAKMAA